MSALIEKLKGEIIEQLNLEDVSVEDIKDDEQLFGGGLGLDSIDALELIVLLERGYGIKIASAEEGKKVFYSVKTISEFIEQHAEK
ncbi:phosphopantetheine-binding protein [Flammeovirgaceae bacterium SG7u.111]|nr:phosphopantetheine-binding protein [Flammeovirgaceae bacterium SG7u.132]WPO36160.1 phosphopantetheine-binding protein [Flammeovirgaceae bacterium SG7u.111]